MYPAKAAFKIYFSCEYENKFDTGKELMFHIGTQNHIIYSYSTMVSMYWRDKFPGSEY